MRYLILLAVFIALSVSFAGIADACIELKAAKAEYLPGETAQIEINADTTRPLSLDDIALYRNSTKMPTAIFMSKVSETKYFIWFNFPDQPDIYTIRARGFCPDLRATELPIEIQSTIASRHLDLKTTVKDKWKTLPLEDHILAAGALSYDEIFEQAFLDYVKRADSCANSNCSTKDAALTLIAFKNSQLQERMKRMLEVYQNNALGEWKVQITSQSAQQCNFSDANTTTTISINEGTTYVDLISILQPILNKSIDIEIKCEKNASAELGYSYNGFSKKYGLEQKGNTFEIKIDNSGCWGDGLKTACDADATAYALLSLELTKNLDSNNSAHASALAWLQENAKTAEEKAVLYLITKDSGIFAELLNSQTSAGFWLNDLNRQDIRGTSLALFSLKNSNETDASNAISKANAWLKGQKPAFSDESFMLFFAFPSSEIEPVLTVWPGMIKTSSRSGFDLVLSNKGVVNAELNAAFFNSSTATSLENGGIKNLQFKMPPVTTLDGRAILSTLVIDYNSELSNNHHYYNIPLLIFTEKGDVESIGQFNVTEQDINQTGQQTIINETDLLENKTAELNASLLQENFKFAENNITVRINKTETAVKKTTLSNTLDSSITNVELSPSIALQQSGFVRVDPTNISAIGPGEKVNVTVYINPSSVEPKTYNGYVQATATYGAEVSQTYISLIIEVAGIAEELLSCDELGGMVCESDELVCKDDSFKPAYDTDYCCVPAENCSKKAPAGRNIGLLVVAVLIIVLILILVLLKRKPKKEMKTFLEEKAKEYEMKKIRRPPSLTRKTPSSQSLPE